jgi:hypothetical protein
MGRDPKEIHTELETVKKEMNKVDAIANKKQKEAKMEKMHGRHKDEDNLSKEINRLQNDKMNLLKKRKKLEEEEKKALKEQAKK